MHYFYLARCSDDTLYCGYTIDLEKREAMHNSGKGAKYTAGRRPIKIIYYEVFDNQGDAMRREIEVKRWPRKGKEGLINNEK